MTRNFRRQRVNRSPRLYGIKVVPIYQYGVHRGRRLLRRARANPANNIVPRDNRCHFVLRIRRVARGNFSNLLIPRLATLPLGLIRRCAGILRSLRLNVLINVFRGVIRRANNVHLLPIDAMLLNRTHNLLNRTRTVVMADQNRTNFWGLLGLLVTISDRRPLPMRSFFNSVNNRQLEGRTLWTLPYHCATTGNNKECYRRQTIHCVTAGPITARNINVNIGINIHYTLPKRNNCRHPLDSITGTVPEP